MNSKEVETNAGALKGMSGGSCLILDKNGNLLLTGILTRANI